ncbi:hypothetical protein EV421DRAFT_292483 [Armillaria borealis]|uniref:Uncharacterized protein n=1 Tax=Armillaria borealis TaxID=47425 RepID=A0AA39JN25_9AGAR|nr:hypothetical protein EV421DRAFT_292483 [Armillaria borealis]
MWLHRFEDRRCCAPLCPKLAVPSGLSSSSCASFSLVSPALLSLFFPVPFPFPVFACSCVPVHCCSCVCVAIVFVFRCFDPASVYRACLPVAFVFVGPSTVPDPLGSVRHVSQLCLVMFSCLPPPMACVLSVFPFPRVTCDIVVLFPYNHCTPLRHNACSLAFTNAILFTLFTERFSSH